MSRRADRENINPDRLSLPVTARHAHMAGLGAVAEARKAGRATKAFALLNRAQDARLDWRGAGYGCWASLP